MVTHQELHKCLLVGTVAPYPSQGSYPNEDSSQRKARSMSSPEWGWREADTSALSMNYVLYEQGLDAHVMQEAQAWEAK